MIPRIFLPTLLALAGAAVAADQPPPTQPAAKTWLDDVPALRTGGERAFQFREDIDVGPDQLVIYASWAPPNKNFVVLCDRIDGTPVLISIDDHLLIFDPIGGQIVRMSGAAEIVASVVGDTIRTAWGVRTDLSTEAARITTDTDFGGVIKALAPAEAPKLSVDSAKRRVATFKGPNLIIALTVSPTDPPVPVSFSFVSESTTQGIALRFDSFALDGPPPAWHRPIDEAALAKRIPVVNMDDVDNLPVKTQSKLVKLKSVVNSRGLSILRSALRDDSLRETIEKNSQLRLDFDEIRANNKRLAPIWIAALAEQGIKLPKASPTTKPAAKPTTAPKP